MSARKLFNRPLNSVEHTDYLNLPGIITTCPGKTGEPVQAEVTVELTKCPHCGSEGTLTGNGVETQTFWDSPDGKPRRVTLRKQLYQCSNKACGKPCSYELTFLPTPTAKVTTRLTKHILWLIDAGHTYTDIATMTGPDESTIRKIRDQRDSARVAPEHRYTEFLGLDDWKHGRLGKMRAIFVDVGNKMPIDLFKTCRAKDLAKDLARYLEMHPEARVIAIDMSKTFWNLLRKHFPQLTIVIDHYHVKQAFERFMSTLCDQLAKPEAAVNAKSISQQQNLFCDSDTFQKPFENGPKSKEEKRIARRFKKYRRVFMKKKQTERYPSNERILTVTDC
jgi:hypothetical protein